MKVPRDGIKVLDVDWIPYGCGKIPTSFYIPTYLTSWTSEIRLPRGEPTHLSRPDGIVNQTILCQPPPQYPLMHDLLEVIKLAHSEILPSAVIPRIEAMPANELPEATCPLADVAPPSPHTPPDPNLRSYPCDDYLALPREQETWLIRPLIPAGGVANIYGDPKVGKSFAAIQLAAAISGTLPDWLGFGIASSGPVLYVQLDTPRSLWMERLEQIRDSGFDLSRIHFADRESLDTWPFNIALPAHFNRLREEVTRIKPAAVFIDTLREAHQADENDSTESQGAVALLTAATRPAAMILVSHSRKAQMEHGPDLLNDQRGSNYLPGKMDAIIRFTKKHMIYIGRACEEGSVKLKRMDCGLWTPEMAEVDAHIAAIMADSSLTTMSARARRLSEKIGKGEEACRSLLRRVVKEDSVKRSVV